MSPPVVVVPTLVGGARLRACLGAVALQTVTCRVVVVANGAQAQVDVVAPDVEVLRLPVNRGFAGGVNAGIARARELGADYVALLNDDAVPAPDWLARLAAVLDAESRCGAVTPKILIAGTDQIDSAGDGYSRWGLPYSVGRGEDDRGHRDEPGEVFSVSGCAPLYRMSMLAEVGGFDERFFAYYEDVDLSFRARLAGWTARYEPRAVVVHELGASSAGVGGFTRFHAAKNMVFLFVKNMPRPLLLRCLPRLVVAFLAYSAAGVRDGDAGAVGRAWVTVARALPGLLRDRRRVQQTRQVDVAVIDSWLTSRVPPRRLSR
jgi:GT2 family glycosyltransferase